MESLPNDSRIRRLGRARANLSEGDNGCAEFQLRPAPLRLGRRAHPNAVFHPAPKPVSPHRSPAHRSVTSGFSLRAGNGPQSPSQSTPSDEESDLSKQDDDEQASLRFEAMGSPYSDLTKSPPPTRAEKTSPLSQESLSESMPASTIIRRPIHELANIGNAKEQSDSYKGFNSWRSSAPALYQTPTEQRVGQVLAGHGTGTIERERHNVPPGGHSVRVLAEVKHTAHYTVAERRRLFEGRQVANPANAALPGVSGMASRKEASDGVGAAARQTFVKTTSAPASPVRQHCQGLAGPPASASHSNDPLAVDQSPQKIASSGVAKLRHSFEEPLGLVARQGVAQVTKTPQKPQSRVVCNKSPSKSATADSTGPGPSRAPVGTPSSNVFRTVAGTAHDLAIVRAHHNVHFSPVNTPGDRTDQVSSRLTPGQALHDRDTAPVSAARKSEGDQPQLLSSGAVKRGQRGQPPPVTPTRPPRSSVLRSSPVHYLLRSAKSNAGLEVPGMTEEGLVRSEPRKYHGMEKCQGTRSCPRKVADLCRLFDAPSTDHAPFSTPRRQKTGTGIPGFSEALSTPTLMNAKPKPRTADETEAKLTPSPGKLKLKGKIDGRPCNVTADERESPLKQKIHLFEDLSSSDAVDKITRARPRSQDSGVGGPVRQAEIGVTVRKSGTWRGKRAVGILRKISKSLDIHGPGDTQEVPLKNGSRAWLVGTADVQRPGKKIVKRRLKKQPPALVAGAAADSTPDKVSAAVQQQQQQQQHEQQEFRSAVAEPFSYEHQVTQMPESSWKGSTRRSLFKRKSLPFLKSMSALQDRNDTHNPKDVNSSKGSSAKLAPEAADVSSGHVMRGSAQGRTETLRRRFSASLSKAMNPFRSAPEAAAHSRGKRGSRTGAGTNSPVASEHRTASNSSSSNTAAVAVVGCNLQHPRPIRGSEVSLLIGLCEGMESKGKEV
ncbi:hypothetical protein RB595_009327, partial [Gaeumannomyces hyphopodioides]